MRAPGAAFASTPAWAAERSGRADIAVRMTQRNYVQQGATHSRSGCGMRRHLCSTGGPGGPEYRAELASVAGRVPRRAERSMVGSRSARQSVTTRIARPTSRKSDE